MPLFRRKEVIDSIGPDVSKLGKEGTAESLIESVLLPSKVVKKGYETIIITTAAGRTLTGLLAEAHAAVARVGGGTADPGRRKPAGAVPRVRGCAGA